MDNQVDGPGWLPPTTSCASRLPAKAVTILTGGNGDDDSRVSVRYHGRMFHIHLSPKYCTNSPQATELYLRNLQVIHPEGSGETEDILEEDVYGWIIGLFQPIFERLAPDPRPVFNPEKIRNGEVTPLLSDYLFPEKFGCRLDAVDEEFIPRHTDDHGGVVISRTWLDGETLDDLETWTGFFKPSEVEVRFTKPEHALDRMPTKVVVEVSGKKTTCFFKDFGIGIAGGPLNREVDAYRTIHNADLAKKVNLGSLIGVVHQEEDDTILGLLLKHINAKESLQSRMYENVPLETRNLWEKQITDAVMALHSAGGFWGDAKAENVLIDNEDNAWVTDFEGGYTVGWVDKEKAGTVEGDLQGLERIFQLLRGGQIVV